MVAGDVIKSLHFCAAFASFAVMRVLVIDPDPARAALVVEGLSGDGLTQEGRVEIATVPQFAEAQIAAVAPDLVIIACDSPDRDTLDSLREASARSPRPIVMFADRSDPGAAEAAIRAGVAAYVVNGLAPERVRPILEAAVTRFELMQAMRADLAKAKADLASRKTIDRAKGLLMKERGPDEEAAYRTLRKLAMDNGRPIAAVAADLLAFSEVLKGGRSE